MFASRANDGDIISFRHVLDVSVGEGWSPEQVPPSRTVNMTSSRQAHNLKITGSNPVPATTFIITHSPSRSNRRDGRGSSMEGTASTGTDPAAVSKCDELHREWWASIWS